MILVFLLAALVVGAGQPLQAAINAQLRAHLGDPAWATFVSVAVSFTSIGLYLLIRRQPLPALRAVTAVPWWMWTGGLMGVTFVAFGLIVTPRLGAGVTFALIVLGQVLMSLALDHWGMLGLPVHHISPLRILGAGLLVAGVILVRAF